jgi:hypothetical protein
VPCIITNSLDIWLEDEEAIITKKPGTLYFNPEYHFLRIDSSCDGQTPALISFLHELKTAYDPQGIGLRNLALAEPEMEHIGESVKWPNADPHVLQEKFLGIVGQLDEVLLIIEPSTFVIHEPPFLNPSCPAMMRTPAFERLDRDTREISNHLRDSTRKLYAVGFC